MSLKVVHVLPHRGGGGETYIDMLERLPGYEHQRFYLSSGRTPSSGLISIPARWPKLATRVRAADIIHAHGDMAPALALPLLRARPAVMTTHGLSMLRRISEPQRALMIRATTAVVNSCRAVICTSAAERNELAATLPKRHHDKLHVIYNAIDPPSAIDDAQRTAIRDELGVGTATVLGLFAGRLESNKAPLLAARAAARVHAAGVPFVLAVAGEGPQAAELQGLQGDAVKVLGHRSDLHRLLTAADVFVQPSEREGMSFALLEAMGYGLAIVASDGPGNPEAVGDAGLLFAAGDEAALIEALTELGSEPERRESLAASARARVRQEFSPARFLDETAAVYLQSLKRA